ncbi:urease accessory protein F [Trichonephila clavipes]|nr:urease accessory protein F [Trichonephila clavipes]
MIQEWWTCETGHLPLKISVCATDPHSLLRWVIIRKDEKATNRGGRRNFFLIIDRLDCKPSIKFVCAALNIPCLEVGKMYLFNCLRTIIASIVRLGKVGTIQAQHLQFEMQCCLDDILKRNWSLHPEESCISYPLTETLQNSHDTMFSKLFFS